MATIKVENLTFSYPSNGEAVFENASFQIDTDWKTGFIGRNGRGKTTLLKLLCGEYDYRGKIFSPVKFDYFPYPVKDASRFTHEVLHDVCPTAEEWEFMRECYALGVNEETLYRPFGTLSNGEQTKVLLAALFLNEHRFLLIDEPTNHLDAPSREKTAAYLNGKKGFILVSHDRNFLDGCVDHILSLNRSEIQIRSGNYSSFEENYNRQQDFERKQNERLCKDVKRLKETAQRTQGWADLVEASKIGAEDKGYVGHKSAKMMKRAKTTQARAEKQIEKKETLLKNTEIAPALKLLPLVYRSERLVSFSSVVPVYGDKKVCAPVTFEIKRGERIAIEGKNGCGKSSLLKLLRGQNIEHRGRVETGTQLILSYVPQSTAHLSGSLDGWAAAYGIDKTLFKTILHQLGFNKDEFEKDISFFSEGQKKKTLIAQSLCERAHLYVWDEPLNFIDVYSRIQIENLLCEFQPTMIFVEHDKFFRRKIATREILL